MGDLTPEQIAQLVTEFENLRGVLKASGVDVDRFANKSIKNIEDSFQRLEKTVKKSGGSYRDVIGQLSELADAIEDNVEELDTQEKKNEARDRLRVVAEKARNQKLMDMTAEMAGTALKTLFNYQFNQIKVGMRDLMSGSTSAFQMAADLQIQGAQDINAGIQEAATAAGGAGVALMAITLPATRAAGALLAFGGALAGFASSKVTEFFTEKTRILAGAVESAFNSFREASQAGAMFAGGVSQLREVALQSGLTQEQFTKVIAENRDALAQAGYSMSGAVDMVSRVADRFTKDFGKSGQTLRREMQNLGFSIEEQVGLAAEVAANMKRLGGRATTTEVAQATAEYAKNLRLIAEITGDDAKKRMDQARAITESYSFQSKFLREHNNDYAALIKVQNSLAKMEAHERRAVHQSYIRGTTTDVGAIIAGFRDPALNIANVLHQQNFTVEQLDGILYKYRDTLLTEDRTRKEAIASSYDMIGANQEAATAITTGFNAALKGNSDAYRRAQAAVEGAVAPQDQFTESLNSATDELQRLKNTVQIDLTDAIKGFAKEVPDIIKDFEKKLYDIGILKGNTPEGQKIEQVAVGQMRVDTLNAANPMATNFGTTGYTDEDFALAEEKLRKIKQGRRGKADGGIATGPLSGYMEVLHGTEAVVPLPDGETIPVTVTQKGDDQVSKVLQELVNEVKAGNMVTQTSLKELVRAAKDNVTYTAKVAINTH